MPMLHEQNRFEITWPRWRRWLAAAMLLLLVTYAGGVAFLGWADRIRDIQAGTIVSRRILTLLPLAALFLALIHHHRAGIFRGDWAIVTMTGEGIRDRRLSEVVIPWSDVTAIRPLNYPGLATRRPHGVILEMQEAALERLRLGWSARSKVGKLRAAGLLGVPIDTLDLYSRDMDWKVDPEAVLEACRAFHAKTHQQRDAQRAPA